MKALAFLTSLILATAFSPLASANWRPSDGDTIAFDITHKGNVIGRHEVRFEIVDNALTAVNDVDIKVKFGPITVFQYLHDSVEIWEDGALVDFEGRTRRKGDWYEADFDRAGDSLTRQEEPTPPGATPFTHWNMDALLNASHIITDKFAIEPVSVEELGLETLNIGDRQVETRRFRVQSAGSMDIWYDMNGRWVRTAFVVDGADIDYIARF